MLRSQWPNRCLYRNFRENKCFSDLTFQIFKQKMSIRKMNLKLLFCVIFILVGSVETRMSHRKKNCTTCNPIQKSLCDHGQCEIERDCSAFGCICDKGWTGDMCNEECKRNCTRGHCYIIEKEERCACPEGYTSDSNCMEKETNVSLLHFLKGLNSTILRRIIFGGGV